MSLWNQWWNITAFCGTGSKDVKQMALRLSTEKTVVGFKGVFPWISSHMTALTMAIILPVVGVLSSAPDWEPAEKGNSRHKPSAIGSNAKIRYFIVSCLIIWVGCRNFYWNILYLYYDLFSSKIKETFTNYKPIQIRSLIGNYSALKNSTFRVANCSLKTEVSC